MSAMAALWGAMAVEVTHAKLDGTEGGVSVSTDVNNGCVLAILRSRVHLVGELKMPVGRGK